MEVLRILQTHVNNFQNMRMLKEQMAKHIMFKLLALKQNFHIYNILWLQKIRQSHNSCQWYKAWHFQRGMLVSNSYPAFEVVIISKMVSHPNQDEK